MCYAIVTRLKSGECIRNALAPDAALDEAKEQGLRELKKLVRDGVHVCGADIEFDNGAVVSAIIMEQHLTLEYLELAEENYLSAWS